MNVYFKEYFDFKTFFTVVALVLIGLVSVYSATHTAGASASFHRQIVWAAIGFLAMALVMLMPRRLFQSAAVPLYILSLLLLLFVLGRGKTVSGSTSWLGFGIIGGQPSELAKLTTVLAFAAFLSKPTTEIESTKGLLTTTAMLLLPVTLIILQPDAGTAVVFCAMFPAILYWAGASVFTAIAIISPVIVAAAALVNMTSFIVAVVGVLIVLLLLKRDFFTSTVVFSSSVVVGVAAQYVYSRLPLYQQKRIATFLAPDADPLGAGYNALQAKVAIGSGGVLGKGFLHGTQTQLRFIPAQWTDFIYCVPGEEFGFIGAIVVLSLLIFLLFRGVRIASVAKNKFSSLVAIGITSIFAIHTFVNIGMSMGLMPVIGIPLPFMSYGGSSLITSMVMAGLLLNVYATRKEY
ncbi:MAG: rod shape-determining protein RodA [Bacteroidota bacterium]